MKGRHAQLAQDYPVSSCPGVSSCLPLAQIYDHRDRNAAAWPKFQPDLALAGVKKLINEDDVKFILMVGGNDLTEPVKRIVSAWSSSRRVGSARVAAQPAPAWAGSTFSFMLCSLSRFVVF
jgi:hypothetical protein